jgi:hypothetical protein
MTDDSRWDVGASGESSQDPTTPWYPPSGGTGGGYGQPGAHGQPGWQGQAGWYGPGGWQAPPGSAGQPPPGGWPHAPQAPKPGVIPLRPLGVGEILDGAFTTIRRNPRATLGIAAILLTISGVITTVVTRALAHSAGPVMPVFGQQPTPGQVRVELNQFLSVWLPLLGLTIVLYFVVDLVLTGILTVVVGRSTLGHSISAGEAWNVARPRLPALLGLTLLLPLAIVVPWLAWGFVMVVLAVARSPVALLVLFGVVGGITALGFSILIAVRLRLAVPMVVLERQRPWAAVKRSWGLVGGSFWRVAAISALAGLIVLVTGAILQVPFTVLSSFANGSVPFSLGTGSFGSLTRESLLAVIIGTVGGIVAGSVTRPISAGVTTLLYVDLRMRREGLDLVLQTASAGATMTAGDELASVWRPGSPVPFGHASAPGQGGAPPTW